MRASAQAAAVSARDGLGAMRRAIARRAGLAARLSRIEGYARALYQDDERAARAMALLFGRPSSAFDEPLVATIEDTSAEVPRNSEEQSPGLAKAPAPQWRRRRYAP